MARAVRVRADGFERRTLRLKLILHLCTSLFTDLRNILKSKPQGELYDSWVSKRRSDLPKRRAARREPRRRTAEVRMIGCIEEVCPELHVGTFLRPPELHHFDQRDIGIVLTGPFEDSA